MSYTISLSIGFKEKLSEQVFRLDARIVNAKEIPFLKQTSNMQVENCTIEAIEWTHTQTILVIRT